MPHVTLSQRVARSLTLLRVLTVASGAVLAIAAVVLGTILTHAIRAQAHCGLSLTAAAGSARVEAASPERSAP